MHIRKEALEKNMRVSPVNSINNFNFKGSPVIKFREHHSDNNGSPAFKVYRNPDIHPVLPINDKRKAKQIMAYQLITTTNKEISKEVQEEYKGQIEAMQKGVIDMCITYDDYKGRGFNYPKTLEHFFDWQKYVEENNDRLSNMMNTPYEIAQEEKLSLNAYAKKHPNDPKNEILQSTLFKMHELIRMNKPARSHFHD